MIGINRLKFDTVDEVARYLNNAVVNSLGIMSECVISQSRPFSRSETPIDIFTKASITMKDGWV